MDVFEIREGEYLGRDQNTGKYKFMFYADDDIRESKPVIGYMAYFEYLNGFTKTLYWSKTKMLKHADKYSQAFSLEATTGKYPKVSYADYEAGKVGEKDLWKYSSYWYKDFDGMAFKTMLRQLISKWGIMSIEMQEAYTKDMAEIKENGDYEYIDSIDNENIEAVDVTNANDAENTAEVNENFAEQPEVKQETQKVEKEDIRPQTQSNFEYGNTEDEFFN